MAEVRYLGTGEAFDHARPNTSFLVTGEGQRLLVDCGYSIPHALWRVSTDPEFLDGIYLSHFHADHCFGLPAVLARMGQDGRRRPLSLLGGPGSAAAIRRVLELGYPGILQKTDVPLEMLDITPGTPLSWGRWNIRTARSEHSLPNHSVRFEFGGVSLAYSGDGAPSDACRALYTGVDLLIHEGYYGYARDKRSHASIPMVRSLARDAGVARLHVVHLARSAPRPEDLVLPEPGDEFRL